ncbi:MAG: MAPEG family protein [Aliidongia sp.]
MKISMELGAPLTVMRPTRQLANLFEFPVLYYAAVSILIGTGLQDGLVQKLCWMYAALRWAHALSHLLVNRLWLRTPVFAASNLVLLLIWLRMSFLVLGIR